jgi:hypothetical protein
LIRADANRQKGIEGEKGLPPDAAGRAIEEYLSDLDDAAFGAATEVMPKFISPSDPAARWTGAHGRQAFFGYSTNYLIDVDNAIIVDVEATTAIRQAEVLAAKRMIERSMSTFFGGRGTASMARHPPASANSCEYSGSASTSCTCVALAETFPERSMSAFGGGFNRSLQHSSPSGDHAQPMVDAGASQP